MFSCKYCNNTDKNIVPTCCYPQVNKKMLNDMRNCGNIIEVYEKNEYYTKCIIFKLSNGNTFKFNYCNNDLFIENDSLEQTQYNISNNYFYLLVPFIVSSITFYVYKLMSFA